MKVEYLSSSVASKSAFEWAFPPAMIDLYNIYMRQIEFGKDSQKLTNSFSILLVLPCVCDQPFPFPLVDASVLSNQHEIQLLVALVAQLNQDFSPVNYD